jgi:5-methylcytosine-specific restriction endonuclease McrA
MEITYNKGQFKKGHKGYWSGKNHNHGYKIGNALKGKNHLMPEGFVVWNKGVKTGIVPNSAFKKGRTPWNKLNRTPEELRKIRRNYRKANPYQFKAYEHKKRFMRKDLKKSTVQMVYEDNIKKYGTLTCYLCFKPIEFGNDSLEHKMPLIRGGTNEYNNLAISCRSCNSKKHIKTTEEYLGGVR